MSEKTYAIYDQNSGDVVHVHHVTIAPGAEPPSDSELEEGAIQLAIKLGDLNREALAILSVDRSALRYDHSYSVDVESRRLRAVPVESIQEPPGLDNG